MKTTYEVICKKSAAWMIAFVLSAFGVRADVVITTIHSFQTAAGGSQPNTLVLGKDGNLYGTTAGGGTGGHGTVFKFATNGVFTTLHSFNGAGTGTRPYAGLVQGSDGNFYGTTASGGINNYGTVFKITPNGALTSLYSFWRGDSDYPNNGYSPATELIQGSDGNLYSVTEAGGQRGDGVVFKISTIGVYTNLHSFRYDANDGEYPGGALVQGADGDYYGTAGGGGASHRGAIFKITANGVYTNLYSFTGGNDGAGPNRLLLGRDGNFYGTAGVGGTNNFGNVFKLTTDGVCTALYSFSNGNDGRYPGGLVQGIDGDFYGISTFSASNGTVFKVTADGTFTSLHIFTGGNDGAGSTTLVPAPDGNLYGTTGSGGQGRNGTIFKITPDGTFVSLYSFPGTANDGMNPMAALVQGTDGYFYGSTYSGGASNYGTIFKMGPDGALTTLYSFTDVNSGTNPQVALAQSDDGWLYGTTPRGGTNLYFGTIFKISTNGVFTSLYSFTGESDSEAPDAPLVKGTDGNMYGTTSFSPGNVFKISPDGVFTVLHSFSLGTGITNGASPNGLVLGSDGIFYGTTWNGGTLFSITAGGVFNRLCSFGPANAGPRGCVQGADGNFYGTTSGGGAQSSGTVFKFSTNGLLTTLYGGFNLEKPSNLVRGADGNFYGTTWGVAYTAGTIFKITPDGTFTVLHSFRDDDGYALSDLVQGSDGNFYGTSPYGGAGYGAVLRITIGPVFKALTLTNSTLTLTWSTGAGSTYQLQYTSGLNSGNWIDLGCPVIATGSTLTATDSVANDPQRFYRVALLPQ